MNKVLCAHPHRPGGLFWAPPLWAPLLSNAACWRIARTSGACFSHGHAKVGLKLGLDCLFVRCEYNGLFTTPSLVLNACKTSDMRKNHCLTSRVTLALMAFIDLGFSLEVSSAGVLLKLGASNVIMVAFTIRTFQTWIILGGKVRGAASNLDQSSFMISHGLDFEMMP